MAEVVPPLGHALIQPSVPYHQLQADPKISEILLNDA